MLEEECNVVSYNNFQPHFNHWKTSNKSTLGWSYKVPTQYFAKVSQLVNGVTLVNKIIGFRCIILWYNTSTLMLEFFQLPKELELRLSRRGCCSSGAEVSKVKGGTVGPEPLCKGHWCCCISMTRLQGFAVRAATPVTWFYMLLWERTASGGGKQCTKRVCMSNSLQEAHQMGRNKFPLSLHNCSLLPTPPTVTA